MYQQALWISDADPNQAWIMLVGAIEAASQPRGKVSKLQTSEVLALLPSEVTNELRDLPDGTVDGLARQLAYLVKSKRRFLDFFDHFPPPPPSNRPALHLQVDWSEIRVHLGKVYNYRSRALHEGTPFPFPMYFERPISSESGTMLPERPIGLGAKRMRRSR